MVCKKAAEETGRRLREEADRHRTLHVRRVPAAAVREAGRQQAVLPRRAAARRDHVPLHPVRCDPRPRASAVRRARHGLRPAGPDQWVRAHAKLPGVKVAAIEPAELSRCYLNINVKPLDDIRVRQAIAHAIDRKAMVQFQGRRGRRAKRSRSSRPAISAPTAGAALSRTIVAKAKSCWRKPAIPTASRIKIDPIDAARHADASSEAAAGPAEEGRHQSRYRAGRARDLPRQQIRKDLSPIVHYQAARFPVADIYLTQFFHSRLASVARRRR